MAPPFRRKIPDSVKNVLGRRLSLYVKGSTSDYYKPKTRNTAYCTITKNGITVSTREDTFDETYNPRSLKPRPNLLRAEIERIGHDASLVNLSMRIRGTIEVYSLSDFLRYSEVFCINDPKNQLSITMAYANPFDGCPSYKVSGCYIAYGTWQTTNENYYQISFEAIGPGEVFSSVDIGFSGIWDNANLYYKHNKTFQNKVVESQVNGYYELMLYDAQNSGADLTDSIPDGTIVPYMRKKSYEGKVSNGIAYLNFRGQLTKSDIIVYKPVEGAALSADPDQIPTAQTTTDEFFTLQYVVDRLINEFCLYPLYEKYTDSDSGIRDVYVGFSDKPRCSIIFNAVVRSCDPRKILILGNGTGNYKDAETKVTGKDYEKGIALDGIKSHYGNYIDFRKILIHRNTIWEAINSTMHTVEKPRAGVNSKDHFILEEYLRVTEFFKNLFTTISNCTGGFVQLGLIVDDGTNDKDDLTKHKILKIVPTTFVDTGLDIWKFNTLNGDGSTRELSITAELPSTDLHASLVKNIFNNSRVTNAIRSDTNDGLSGRDLEGLADRLLDEYYFKLMPRTKYSDETCDAARNLLFNINKGRSTSSLVNNNQYLWLMKMNVKMDGVGGWRIGHHINSNTVPNSFTTERNIAFVVTKVNHVVEGQDWQTELESICTVVPPGTPTLGA